MSFIQITADTTQWTADTTVLTADMMSMATRTAEIRQVGGGGYTRNSETARYSVEDEEREIIEMLAIIITLVQPNGMRVRRQHVLF